MTLWRDIFESLSDAVLVLSPAMEPRALNPAGETLLGLSHPTGGHVQELLRRNPWLGRMVESCLASGQEVADPDALLELRGSGIAVRAEVSPLLDRDNRPEGVVVLLQNLSHQKRAEQAFGSSEMDLGLSPAGLAHEVKNPLTGIKGAAELLAGMVGGDQRANQYCSVILGGVDRIAALVEQVLAMSGPQRFKRAPVNIHRVLHHALALAGLYPHPPAGILVDQLFDPSLPEVFGDEGALERAFLNLVKNAAEAIAPSGTIRLTTRMETQFRLTSERRRRHFLRVDVADNGPGIPTAEMRHLFTPFFTTKPAGTGLGLVLSHRIIALHGGRLWAERRGADASPSAGEPSSAAAEPARREDRDAGAVRGMTFKVILPAGPDQAAGGRGPEL